MTELHKPLQKKDSTSLSSASASELSDPTNVQHTMIDSLDFALYSNHESNEWLKKLTRLQTKFWFELECEVFVPHS
jgi:hypothetical protein